MGASLRPLAEIQRRSASRDRNVFQPANPVQQPLPFRLTDEQRSLALSLHSFIILLIGKFVHDQVGLITSLLGLLQFTVIMILLVSLLRKDAREWIWNA